MPKILVVDDDEIDREAVKRYLSRAGSDIDFCEAATGGEAARFLEGGRFDCVFLDYNLPDVNGISLLRQFYDEDTGLTPAPVVMLTGQGSEAVMIDAIRWGAQDYLVKDHLSPDTLKIAMTKAREFYELKRGSKQAEEQLRQSQKMEAVGQLTSGVAHDFNNLLTVILGNTRMMTKRFLSENAEEFSREELEKKIEAIESAARKGADLVKRLMVFTRQQPLVRKTVDINERIGGIRDLLERTLGETIEVETKFDPDAWPVTIDAGQLENALINMAVNARDAMATGGRLTLETRNVVLGAGHAFTHEDTGPGSYVMLAVSDTGTGMKPETARRIFEPFFTTKKAGEGTGLGLSMVYGFVRQSGGHIEVQSKPGRGTTVRIYLPKAEDEAAGAVENEGYEQARKA